MGAVIKIQQRATQAAGSGERVRFSGILTLAAVPGGQAGS